ncbi:hypothetical protein CBS101457_001636 [Exobasidium rhododendri]|nr:hypothetical protein CBS101457_001636 [Exobasidium rhododendri]
MRFHHSSLLLASIVILASLSNAFQVAISDLDPMRQTCSGMWKGKDTKIELSFDKGSAGTVSTLFYEFADFSKVGKESKEQDVFGFPLKTYICTSQAVMEGLCTQASLGNFIVSANATSTTSIFTQRVDLGTGDDLSAKTVTYNVTRKGYYCVGATAVPMTTQANIGTGNLHSHFTGRINYINTFEGQLPATEYPKLPFYFSLTSIYMILGGVWLYLCISHRDELLTVQHFVSGTIILLVLGCAAQWGYFRYLNTHSMDFWRISSLDGVKSVTFGARSLLVITSVLDAARNSTSLFLLLIVSMGYGVVRPSIGPVMTKVKILTAVHFLCGVLYSVGIVLILTESGGGWIFLFIFPLAFTLTTFMMWTLHSLNATIEYLLTRKQTFKGQMFRKLYRILVFAVVAIFVFFILTTIAFSQSATEDFSPNVWAYRWFLLDGWMGTLYLVVFSSIAWLWRPTGQNLRLSMSDEIGQDDGYEGEHYEIDEFGQHAENDGDEEEGGIKPVRSDGAPTARAAPSGGGAGNRRFNAEEEVVFEIGDDEEETPRKLDGTGEREGLMNRENNDSKETLVPARQGH